MGTLVNEQEGFDPDDYEDPPDRRPRGYLQNDVNNVCREYVAGEFTLAEGVFLTPYVVGTIIIENNNNEIKRPSPGAIAAIFKRWQDWGYATFRIEPFAFVDFTDKARALGLQGFLNDRKKIRRNRSQGVS